MYSETHVSKMSVTFPIGWTNAVASLYIVSMFSQIHFLISIILASFLFSSTKITSSTNNDLFLPYAVHSFNFYFMSCYSGKNIQNGK